MVFQICRSKKVKKKVPTFLTEIVFVIIFIKVQLNINLNNKIIEVEVNKKDQGSGMGSCYLDFGEKVL